MKINKEFTNNMDLLKYCRKVAKRYNTLHNTRDTDYFIYPYDLYNDSCIRINNK